MPQLLKFADQLGGRPLENDPFGQSFLERISKTTERVRNTRLKKIGEALTLAVPQFKELRFVRTIQVILIWKPCIRITGPTPDGNQKSIFLMEPCGCLGCCALLDGSSMLLLEEPEISLNDAVVKEIPLIIQRLQRTANQSGKC